MNFFKSSIAVFVLMSANGGIAGEVQLPITNAPPRIELNDQYNSPQNLSFPTTNITVLAIADRKGSEQVEAWVVALKQRYPDSIDIFGLAQVGGAPGFIQGRIRKRFQELCSYPVMMDWSGKVCAQFGYQPGVVNVLILGRDGRILGRFAGAAGKTNSAAAFIALDKALLLEQVNSNK